MINSPRSIQACKELGIIPSELYKLSMEEYKNKFGIPINTDQKMLKLRYDGYERFRKESISLVVKRREVIISKEKERKIKEKNFKKSKTDNNYVFKSLDKIKEGEKKTFENIKIQQRKNIKSMIKSQIKEELYKKKEQKKEWIQQKREEQLKKEREENKINSKKSEIEAIERRKKIEEKNKEREELVRLRLDRQKKIEDELKKKKQKKQENDQKKLTEEYEKFQK